MVDKKIVENELRNRKIDAIVITNTLTKDTIDK